MRGTNKHTETKLIHFNTHGSISQSEEKYMCTHCKDDFRVTVSSKSHQEEDTGRRYRKKAEFRGLRDIARYIHAHIDIFIQ